MSDSTMFLEEIATQLKRIADALESMSPVDEKVIEPGRKECVGTGGKESASASPKSHDEDIPF